MSETALTAALVPVSLAVLMLALGLSLETADFRRVLRSPRALAGGLGGQLLLLPVLGILVASLSGVAPKMAVGFVILSLCPGGALSNAICGLFRADAALSVSLTALSSVITPITIPLFYGWTAGLWIADVPSLELPVLPTMARLLAISVVPIALGMAIRSRYGSTAARLEKPARILSTLLFIAVVAIIVAQNLDALRNGFRMLGASAIALNLAATGTGLALARLVRLPAAGTITLGIEVGMQNVATATFVTATLLGDPVMALGPAVYALVMLPTAVGLGLVASTFRVPARTS